MILCFPFAVGLHNVDNGCWRQRKWNFGMRLHSRIKYLISVTLFTSFASGCAFNPFSSSDTPDVASASSTIVSAESTFDTLAARDVVSVLRQIDTLAPESTTLGTSTENLGQERFADALKQELQAAGYAMRVVDNGPDTVPVSFEFKDENGDNQTQSRTLTVFAGNVAVRRTYGIDNAGNITPLSSMQIRGADASDLVPDDNIFAAPANAPIAKDPPVETAVLPDEQMVKDDISAVPVPDAPLTKADDSLLVVAPSSEDIVPSSKVVAPSSEVITPSSVVVAPSSEVVTPSSTADLSATATINSNVTDSSLLDLVAPSVPAQRQVPIDIAALRPDDTTENFMDLQQSNFANAFADMGIVREKVLTFPNDSTFMGDENKTRLKSMLDGFNAQSDVLSVIGCSMGATNHAGGQEALARGRALRVRDELLYAGVPEENILEEGCWAEEAFDQRMPRRGVVVTLKRRLG